MGQCAPEDSISQCPFLQMIDTAGNPHADGSAAPGARPRHRPSRHRDPPATSRAHDNWMAARQTSCRQQTAPPPPRCSKDVTAHPHRPGARPGRPCQVPARSGQPLSGRSGFSPAFGTELSGLPLSGRVAAPGKTCPFLGGKMLNWGLSEPENGQSVPPPHPSPRGVFRVAKRSRPRREWFAALKTRGGARKKWPVFGGQNAEVGRVGARKLAKCAGPPAAFLESQNAHAPGVSGLPL